MVWTSVLLAGFMRTSHSRDIRVVTREILDVSGGDSSLGHDSVPLAPEKLFFVCCSFPVGATPCSLIQQMHIMHSPKQEPP